MITINTNLDKVTGDIDFFEYFLSLYRNEYVEISKEETYELINKAQQGDKESFNKVLLYNLPLAIKYAYKYAYACEVEDLIQQGVLGLMNAINHFDTSTDYAFSTYAWHWIRQSMVRYIDECGFSLKRPVHVQEKLRKYKRIMNGFVDYDQETGKYNFEKKLMYALEHKAVESKNEFIAMEDMVKNEYVFSLDYNIEHEYEELNCLKDMLVDDSFDVEKDFIEKQKVEKILYTMDTRLTDAQAEVLKMRFGLDPYLKPMTLEEIGKIKGISRERVRQIQNRAIDIIKQVNYKDFS